MLKRVIQEIQTVLETSRTTPIKLGQHFARSRASIYTVVGEETEKVAKQTVSGDARDIVHCLREVLTLMVLGPSDMAVKVYGLFMGSMCWDETIMVSFRFSMKLMSGGQLPLVSDTFENQSRCVRLLFESALVVYFLHSLHLHHRDIKEQNFLLDDDHVYISDLESTRFRETGTDVNSMNWMTRDYAAPEVSRGRYGFPADVYSLGRVFAKVPKDKFPKIRSLSRDMCKCVPEQRPSIRNVVRYFLEEVPDIPDKERGRVRKEMQERFERVKEVLLEYQECVIDIHFDLAPASWSKYLWSLWDPSTDEKRPQIGRIFERDDATILRFFKDNPTKESLALQKKIDEEGSSYTKGCLALAHGKVAEAVTIFHDGAKHGCLLCLTELGIVLHDLENKEKGLKLLEIAAQKGSVRAMLKLAIYCWRQERIDDGIFWLKQAASLGHEASAWAVSHFIPIFS